MEGRVRDYTNDNHVVKIIKKLAFELLTHDLTTNYLDEPLLLSSYVEYCET